jgi:hypothetical protein
MKPRLYFYDEEKKGSLQPIESEWSDGCAVHLKGADRSTGRRYGLCRGSAACCAAGRACTTLHTIHVYSSSFMIASGAVYSVYSGCSVIATDY